MFGLSLEETLGLAGFALATLGALVRVSVQVGKVLTIVTHLQRGLHDHEARIRRAEARLGLPPAPLEQSKVVSR